MILDLDKWFSEKNITVSSKNLYMKNLKRLKDGNKAKNVTFLNDAELIQEKLAKYKPNTQRSYIIAIVSFLKQGNKSMELHYIRRSVYSDLRTAFSFKLYSLGARHPGGTPNDVGYYGEIFD
jgi:hypothetical protein